MAEKQGENSGGGAEKPLPTSGASLPSATWGSITDGFDSIVHPMSKGGVFSGAVKVATGKNTYETEKAESDFKLLQPDSMASAIAMAGMQSGVHQHTIRGNSVYHFLQNRLRFVDGNDALHVLGTELNQITGDANFAYLANRKVAVGQNDEFAVKGTLDTFVLGKSTEQFVGSHEVTAPEEFEWKQLERGFSALKLDMATFGLDIHAAAADIHAVDAELIGAETKSTTFSDVNKAMKMQLVALLLAGAIELAVVARLNIAPDFGDGTPVR